jgi:hypothetical protein
MRNPFKYDDKGFIILVERKIPTIKQQKPFKVSSEYKAWHNMKQRCYNKNNPGYKDYGERGIKVCERWYNSFRNFLKDMGRKPSPELSLERINNDGNYEPDNCRWATQSEQLYNRRLNSGY